MTSDATSSAQVAEPSGKESQRFLWVDAIRGLACAAVVLRHLGFPPREHPGLAKIFPFWLQWLHGVSAAGVYAFFVLSGFVVAHSLRSNSLNRKSVANFILRRQVRLDPLYWFALAVYLAVTTHYIRISPRFLLPKFLINAFYLQDLLHKRAIIGPSWTLCIEIQFYLVFIAVLVLGKSTRKMIPENNATIFSVGIIVISGLAALGLKFLHFFAPLFISYWHYFVLGVLSYYAMQGVISKRVYGIFLLAFGASTFCSPLNEIAQLGSQHSLSLASMLVGLATGVSLFAAGTRGKMEKWGNTPVLQYLGKISYPLYLAHPLVIFGVTQLFRWESKYEPGPSVVIYGLAIVASILVAHLLHLFVEKPSMKLAARLKGAF